MPKKKKMCTGILFFFCFQTLNKISPNQASKLNQSIFKKQQSSVNFQNNFKNNEKPLVMITNLNKNKNMKEVKLNISAKQENDSTNIHLHQGKQELRKKKEKNEAEKNFKYGNQLVVGKDLN